MSISEKPVAMDPGVTIESSPFGVLSDGQRVKLFTFTARNGITASISEFGSTITSICIPDRTGKSENITLGYSTLDDFVRDSYYMGAVVGRYANRIANASFRLNGHVVHLSANSAPHHLHGGISGFNKRLWQGKLTEEQGIQKLQMSLLSQDGDEGYPGNLHCRVTYSMSDTGLIDIVMEAETDARTVVNLTQHPYFNLNSQHGPIYNHSLQIFADEYLPISDDLIPVGTGRAVEDTPFDFREAFDLGARLAIMHEDVRQTGGFDHCWLISGPRSELRPAARLYEPGSGRYLCIDSDAPGIQFYSGNQLGMGDQASLRPGFVKHGALCLEPQALPNSPNFTEFPSTVLNPGEVYRHHIRYRFGIDKQVNG